MVKDKIGIKFKPKEKILKYLIENKEPVSIREISSATAIDYKNTHALIGSLETSGAIIKEIMGNTNPIRINLSPNQEIFSVEQKRTHEFLSKNPKFKIVKEDIEEINYPFMIVIIFGSFAKGTNTQNSDLDICIISDNKNKTEKLIQSLKLLSLKIEIQDFTTSEFASMINKKEKNLGHEIVKNNIILFGIENYYNLITKWMKTE
jgi:predicted nucleotidyltransferase